MVTGLVTVNGNIAGGPRVKNVKRHGWTLRLWPRPDITERIQNLIDEAMLP